MKRFLAFMLFIVLLTLSGISVCAINNEKNEAESTSLNKEDFELDAKSAILIEANTGKILFSQNENEKASPASVTKIMTLLLVMEAIRDERVNLNDKVIISDYASSMGGSQVFLSEGEEMTLEELLKCTVIASANDAAVALAEHVYGSEKIFVNMMNKRASELGMNNTNFENVTGLDDTTENHYTSALDIAIMSSELIKYDKITEYSSLWQDSIRDGEFILTNTNRLVRYYEGCNGLKTGSTNKAGYCISASAKRDDMQLIAVIMGAPTRDARNSAARTLLDYGFSSYSVYKAPIEAVENLKVLGGTKSQTIVYSNEFHTVIEKVNFKKVEKVYEIPDFIKAPLKKGDVIGKITYKIDGNIIGESDIVLYEDVEKITVMKIFCNILSLVFKGKLS